MPWSAIGMMGAAALGGAINAGSAYAMSERAHRNSVTAYQHRHQWAVEDLRKAGLNPILSAGGAAGQSPTQAPGGGTNMDLPGALNKASASSLAREQVKTQQDQQTLIKQEADKKLWESSSARSEAYMNGLAERSLTGFTQGMTPQEKLFGLGRAATQAGISPASAVSSAAGLAGRAFPAGRALSLLKKAK